LDEVEDMVNKYLPYILVFPAIFWLFIGPIYSPWYAENLFSSPLIILLSSLTLNLVFIRYIKIKTVLICFIVNVFIVAVCSLRNIGKSDSTRCNNPINVFQFNINYDHKHTNRLSRFLNKNQYDLVVLQEISPLTRAALIKNLSPFYPYFITGVSHLKHLETDQLILSRYRFTDTQYHLQLSTSHLIQTQWHVNQKNINLFTLHPPSPRTHDLWKKRNLTFYQLLDQVNILDNEKVLLVGDFNLSSYSSRMEQFTRALSWSFIGSWPNSSNFPAYFTLAIDHIFVDLSTKICSRERIDNFNYSDHYPILTKISL
jgi:endonuclease/exonuclease/phosphatase (EEP) superfamily protein YafD